MQIAPQPPQTAVEEVAVILVGQFNPLIFQPAWFSKEHLLRDSEATDAKITLIHPDVATFSTEWLTIQVTREQFSASIKADVYSKHICDLVSGTFQKLSHTPIQKMGINLLTRVGFRDEADWHALGHLLNPKSPWSGVLKMPGMRGLQVQGQREDDFMGHLLVNVNPDLETKSDVLVRVNDHYESPETIAQPSSGWVSDLLTRNFESSLAKSRHMTEVLIHNFLSARNVDAGAKDARH